MPYPNVNNGDSGSVARGKINAGLNAQRTILSTDTTFYVATTGSDTTGDGSVGKPWATAQHASDVICGTLDASKFNVFVQFADGTYEGFCVGIAFTSLASLSNLNNYIFYSSPSVVFQGNLSNPSAVIFTENSNSVGTIIQAFATQAVSFAIKNVTLDGNSLTQDGGLFISQGGNCAIGDGTGGTVRLLGNTGSGANTAGDAIRSTNYGFIALNDNITYEGGTFDYAVFTDIYSEIYTSWASNCAISMVSNPHFSGGFAFAYGKTLIDFRNATITGAATGPRFVITNGGSINAPGNGLDFFAGDSSGTVSSGGIYVSNAGTIFGASQYAGTPSATNLVPGSYGVFKDISGGGVYLAYNDAGTIKKVALT